MNKSDARTVLVTGATSGIGQATAERMRAAGHNVHAVGRADADLADPRQVRRLAERMIADQHPPDTLVLAAAVANPPERLTEDGIDRTLVVNHLSQLLLVHLLAEQLGNNGRVVFVGSSQHSSIRTWNPHVFDPDSGATAIARYETTKLLTLLNLAFVTIARDRPGPRFSAIDPGFVRTRLGRSATGAFKMLLAVTRPIQRPPSVPAGLIAHVATGPDFADGEYRGQKGPARRSQLASDLVVAADAAAWSANQLSQWAVS